jgi:pimeloyl-ACP methyl ester carboxylesterase/DNA-binding CsgD family transcriptional regulator
LADSADARSAPPTRPRRLELACILCQLEFMSLPAQEIRFCKSSDGVRIAYAICGAGPALVRVGPWVTHVELDWNTPIWRPWLQVLTSRHTLIRYDFREHGLSDRQTCDVAFERQVDDLDAVILSARTGRCVLLGIAGGCAIAIAYAVRWPDRVDRLVLFGGFSRGSIARSKTAEEAEAARTVLRVMELGGAKEDPAFRQLFTAQSIPDATPEQTRAFNELMRASGGTKGGVSVLRALYEVDVRDIAAKVRCPTLVLHPTHNFRVPYEEGRSLASLIPKARFVPLKSRNAILLEQEAAWAEFASELQAFLAAPKEAISPADDLAVGSLTQRECEVLELLAQGLDNNRIARDLGISEKTVRNYVSAVIEKLGCRTRAEVIVRSRDAGLGRRPAR